MITFVPDNVEGDDLVYKPETVEKNKEACKHCVEKSTIDSDCIDDAFFECASRLKELNITRQDFDSQNHSINSLFPERNPGGYSGLLFGRQTILVEAEFGSDNGIVNSLPVWRM